MNDQNELQAKNTSAYIKKYLKSGITIMIIIVLISIIVIMGLKNFSSSESKTTKIGFEDIGELATQAAYCTEVNVTEASRDLWGLPIPFTQSKYIYSYDVVVKAGFNFGDIKWNLDEENFKIEVQLPEIQILDNDIVPNSFKIYHEQESIFRQITLEENNEAQEAMKQNAVTDAMENGILEDARDNAETILTGFFANVYDLNKYEIKFTDQGS